MPYIAPDFLFNVISSNGLPPDRHQAVTWTIAHLLLTRQSGMNFSAIWIAIDFSVKKIHFCINPLCSWLQIDESGSGGHINVSELGQALEVLGYKIPPYQVRDYIREYEKSIDGDQLDFEAFKQVRFLHLCILLTPCTYTGYLEYCMQTRSI